MDINVSLLFALSNKKDIFTLDSPCICCGKPSVDVWNYKKFYDLKRWVAGSAGKPITQSYKDEGGMAAKGEIEFNLPYCSEHLDQSKQLSKYHGNQMNFMIIAGAIAVVLYFVLFGSWSFDFVTRSQFWGRMCVLPFLVFVGIMALGSIAIYSINQSRASDHKYKDYPINSREGGGSGLAITVESEKAGEIGRYLRHSLKLEFKNVEAAKQFKQKYPASLILQGQDLIE